MMMVHLKKTSVNIRKIIQQQCKHPDCTPHCTYTVPVTVLLLVEVMAGTNPVALCTKHRSCMHGSLLQWNATAVVCLQEWSYTLILPSQWKQNLTYLQQQLPILATLPVWMIYTPIPSKLNSLQISSGSDGLISLCTASK